MSAVFENPFADYGTIVAGGRFIGRKESLNVLQNRVTRPQSPGNLAVIGEPRIGKSSLVYKAIMERKPELLEQRLLPIWINLGTYEDANVFLRSLVTICYDELEELNWITAKINQVYDRVIQKDISWGQAYGSIQRFFQRVRQEGIRVLFVLDEFDHARSLFKHDTSGFQSLRELSYRPEWRVTFVTTSRRSIREIEIQTRAISTFDGIFHKHFLSMFDEVDMKEYYARLGTFTSHIETSDKHRIEFYCGGHPFLLEMLGYQLVEVYRDENCLNVDLAAKQVEASFIDQYDRMLDILQEDGKLEKLLQVLFGPVVNISHTDIDELMRYGFIKLDDRQVYVAFSEHFYSYLRLIEREVDLWPLWSQTEKAMRQVISRKMTDKHGDNWIAKLEMARPNLKDIFDRARKAQINEEKSFGTRASQNLVDFTYPQDLFAIIFFEWKDLFQAILHNDKNYWQQCANLLAKIRNPLAHNRDQVLYEADVKKAEGYCKEILVLVEN